MIQGLFPDVIPEPGIDANDRHAVPRTREGVGRFAWVLLRRPIMPVLSSAQIFMLPSQGQIVRRPGRRL